MQKLIFSLVIIVLGGAVYAGMQGSGFVWNDREVVFGEDAAASHQGVSGAVANHSNIPRLWHTDKNQAYEPLAPTVWILAAEAAGHNAQPVASPRLYHSLSIGFHLASATLVFLILALLLQGQGAACVGALLFAVHPLQVESVAYIAAFKFVLGGFFALLAIWQYLVFLQGQASGRSRNTSGRAYYVGTVSFVLAVLASTSMVVVPLIAWLLARLLPKKSSLMASRPPAWPLALWSVLAIPAAVLAINSQNTHVLASQMPFWAKPIVAADAVSFYLSKVFVPVLIGPDYGRSPMSLIAHWWGFLTWLIPAMLFLLLGYWRSKAKIWYNTGLAVFIAGLAPFLGLIYFEAQATSTVANRFAYLAMLAPALAAAYTVAMPKKTWLPLAIVGATVLAGYLSVQNLKNWKNDEALWSHAVAVNPASGVAHKTLGDSFRRSGDWQNAREHYEKALASNALTPDIHFYLGEIERLHGDPKKAVIDYKRTIELDPNFAQAWVHLGLSYLDSGESDLALEHLKKAVELAPDNEESLRDLGLIYSRKGQFAEAIPYLNRALRLAEDPASGKDMHTAEATTHALLGLALAATHQGDVAQGHLESALKLDPENREANRTLADIYYGQGKFDLARPHYEKVIAQGDHEFSVYYNLGHIVSLSKEYSKAVGYFGKALEQKPNSPEALSDIGVAHFRLRQLKDAEENFKKALALKPDLADPHYYLGDIARWQSKEPEAIAEYYRALKIDPNHPEANYRLGNYYMHENKVSQAIRHFQAALRVAPEDTRLIYSLKRAEKAKESGANPDQGKTTAF